MYGLLLLLTSGVKQGVPVLRARLSKLLGDRGLRRAWEKVGDTTSMAKGRSDCEKGR